MTSRFVATPVIIPFSDFPILTLAPQELEADVQLRGAGCVYYFHHVIMRHRRYSKTYLNIYQP